MRNLRLLFLLPLFIIFTARASGGGAFGNWYDPTVVVGQSDNSALLLNVGNNVTAKQSNWAINIWGVSHHTARPTLLNEKNWGLGARYYHGLHWFSEVNGVYDSFKGPAFTVGTGLDYSLIRIGEYSLHAEMQLMYAYYGYASYLHKKAKQGVIAFPELAFHKGNISLGVTVVPKKSLKEVEVYLFHITYRP